MENKKFKFISAYAIYIGVIAFIIFFGKDFLNLTFLIFENLWNFFSAIEGVYYGIGIVLFCSLVPIWISIDISKNKIVGILIFLLIVTPLLFLFFYYSNANFSLDYFRKLYDLEFPIGLIILIVINARKIMNCLCSLK
ncbi:TPA: hypothetical protein R2J56_001796 [Campylobacter coli]|nr:hypothetical protein [Campylobacter coli]